MAGDWARVTRQLQWFPILPLCGVQRNEQFCLWYYTQTHNLQSLFLHQGVRVAFLFSRHHFLLYKWWRWFKHSQNQHGYDISVDVAAKSSIFGRRLNTHTHTSACTHTRAWTGMKGLKTTDKWDSVIWGQITFVASEKFMLFWNGSSAAAMGLILIFLSHPEHKRLLMVSAGYTRLTPLAIRLLFSLPCWHQSMNTCKTAGFWSEHSAATARKWWNM